MNMKRHLHGTLPELSSKIEKFAKLILPGVAGAIALMLESCQRFPDNGYYVYTNTKGCTVSEAGINVEHYRGGGEYDKYPFRISLTDGKNDSTIVKVNHRLLTKIPQTTGSENAANSEVISHIQENNQGSID
jgi:hypothetical protein